MKIKFISLFLLCFTVATVQAQVDRSIMPKSGPAPTINLGTPTTFTLDNGLTVLIVEDHSLPRVRASLTIDNKPYAQGDVVGVKSLYSAMMGHGTKSMGEDAFNQRIDFLGANVGYGSESAYASSLSRYFDEVFGLMAQGLLQPKLTQEEFETQKKRMIQGIEAQEKSTKAIASNLQDALAYGIHHPYGEFPTVESVKGIALSDVETYYQSFISPKNAYLVIVGDISTRDAKKLAKKHFDNWIKTTPPSSSLPAASNVQYTQVNFVNVSNAVQSEIAVMNTEHLKKTNSDYFAAKIANQILGGGGDGRLFQNLREDKAFTYGAYSSLGSDQYVAKFEASASVRNAVTDSAVTAFLYEINRIRDEKVSLEELNLAKAKYTGNFVRALESPSTIARFALSIEKDNLPKDFYINYLKNINAVTVEDVQEAAQKYFKANHLRIVIAGKGSAVASGLEKLTHNGKPIPVKYFNKDAEPIEAPAFTKAVPEDVTVKSIYTNYIEAIGGQKAVEGINTVYAEYTGSMGPRTLTLITKGTKAGKSMTVVKMGEMVLSKTVFDGATGYTKARGQKIPFSAEQLEKAKKQAGLFDELAPAEDAKVVGIENIDGEEAYAVKQSENNTDYYSAKTGLKLQTVISSKRGASTVTYSDYKMINGVKFPQTISRTLGPKVITFKANTFKTNEGVSAADFE